ncbi:MAG: cyclic pyranopterin monophosphate synthase MoaC [Candidatus Lokiarchaeota archaeon]|nr:cyclic pyranopterin monophosphate synthase MoaC [Candidatus Lokiarchaeota archaeon]MBD3200216.1 cyclic pyranopterin monophosphate synthase MoaC [Candidatus Lokiarchaeota archaeon]
MINISKKDDVIRKASASGKIILKPSTIERIKNNTVKKGDVKTIARIAGINAVKKVPDLIPLCHSIPITSASIEFKYEDEKTIKASCKVESIGKTGVEMEALTGVSVALLNIWDLVKMYEKDQDGQYPSAIIKDIEVDLKLKKRQN